MDATRGAAKLADSGTRTGGSSGSLGSAAGDADLVLRLPEGPHCTSAVWILEVGLWSEKLKAGPDQTMLNEKLEQAKGYAPQYAYLPVMVCAVVVAGKGKFLFAWAQRGANSSVWQDLGDPRPHSSDATRPAH